MELVGIDQVTEAAERLVGVAARTPLEISRVLSEQAGGQVFLKCENLQRTGAFKIRGAYNCIAKLSDEQRNRGVVAASAGNHAQGVALGASLLGVKATVFMPEGAALPKVEATTRYGAEVVLEGSIYDEAFAAAQAFAAEAGLVMVHPFDHPDVIAGQGTVGLEIMDQLANVATIIVPVGGGGLISGIAVAAKARNPSIRIVGVEPVGAAGVALALESGKVQQVPVLSTVADGLAAQQTGELCLAHVQRYVDEMITVTDEEIGEALLLAVERAKLLVEPAGAAGVAAILGAHAHINFPAAVVVSGGNIDPLLLLRVIRFGMGSAGRYFSFRTTLFDRPGELHTLSGVISGAGANIVGIEHRREGTEPRLLGDVEVAIQVETRGSGHVKNLIARLNEEGYTVLPI
ncbi:MAG: threonine ammonia-lyase [Actinomycetota bacterium]